MILIQLIIYYLSAQTIDRESLWLHTNGTRIEYTNGTQIILRGMVIEDPLLIKTDAYGFSHWGVRDFAEMNQWNSNVVHVPVHPDLYKQNPNYTLDYLDPVVNWSIANGMYVMIDWMAHGNILTGRVNNNSFVNHSPWSGGSIYDPNPKLARSFLADVSERYKDNPYVLYSIFNEPEYISWNEWGPEAENLTDVVRAHNPRSLVFVPGVYSGYDISGAKYYPVNRTNIVYVTHPYVDRARETHGTWDSDFGDVAYIYPVMAGEWGYIPGSSIQSVNATTEDYGLPLVKYMDQHNMSWTAFAFSKSWLPMLNANNKTGYEPTEFGALVKTSLSGV